MKLIEDYKDRIENLYLDYQDIGSIPRGGFCWINEDYKEILLEDVSILNFTSLYCNIIIGLYDYGYLDNKESNNIERIRYFLQNRENIKNENIIYTQEKLFANSYYVYLYQKYNKTARLVIEFLWLFYNDFIKENKDNLVYIDVDMIVYINDIKMDIGLEFFLEKCEFFQINSKKRYITCIDGVYELHGYHRNKTTKENIKLDEIKSKIISKRREDKLNKILN